jgi:hypothetical protein
MCKCRLLYIRKEFTVWIRDKVGSVDEKIRGRKSRASVPLSLFWCWWKLHWKIRLLNVLTILLTIWEEKPISTNIQPTTYLCVQRIKDYWENSFEKKSWTFNRHYSLLYWKKRVRSGRFFPLPWCVTDVSEIYEGWMNDYHPPPPST